MSKDALETMKRLVPNLRVVHHNKNTGMEVLYGLDLKITGQANFYTDGDAQYDVRIV